MQQAVAGNEGMEGVLYWLFQSQSTGAKSSPGKSIDRVEYGIVPSDSTWGAPPPPRTAPGGTLLQNASSIT